MRSVALRRTAAAVALAVLAACGTDRSGTAEPGAVAGSAPSPAASSSAQPVEPAQPKAELPQGGTKIFPTYRVVAYYGTAGTGTLGVLGEASPDTMLPKLRSAAKDFAGHRKIQVAYELIASVAQAGPGRDGDYSQMIDLAKIQQARAAKARP